MSCTRYALTILTVLTLGWTTTRAESPAAAKFEPNLIIRTAKPVQPFGGEIRFVRTPELTKTCSLKVVLTAFRPVADSVVFRVTKAEVYAMPVLPGAIAWVPPSDSGATRTLSFSFQPNEVGSHHLSLELRQGKLWQPLARLQFDINEDGETICAGVEGSCQNTTVPPHALRTRSPLLLSYPINELVTDRQRDRHFSAQFQVTAAKTLSDSVMVDFDLQCHVGLYTSVQFIVEHTNNLALSPLPPSWGDNAGPAEGYQFFHGHFSFLALKAGLTQLNFKVSGKHPLARKATRITTVFPIYLVISETGEVLFAGGFDPFTRFKSATDPMLGSLQSLLAVTNRDFRLRNAISQPDYFGQEIALPEDDDSTAASDSLK